MRNSRESVSPGSRSTSETRKAPPAERSAPDSSSEPLPSVSRVRNSTASVRLACRRLSVEVVTSRSKPSRRPARVSRAAPARTMKVDSLTPPGSGSDTSVSDGQAAPPPRRRRREESARHGGQPEEGRLLRHHRQRREGCATEDPDQPTGPGALRHPARRAGRIRALPAAEGRRAPEADPLRLSHQPEGGGIQGPRPG